MIQKTGVCVLCGGRTRVCLLEDVCGVCVCMRGVDETRKRADVIRLQLSKAVPKSIVVAQILAHWVYALSNDTSKKYHIPKSMIHSPFINNKDTTYVLLHVGFQS